jgi:hypothetical protein
MAVAWCVHRPVVGCFGDAPGRWNTKRTRVWGGDVGNKVPLCSAGAGDRCCCGKTRVVKSAVLLGERASDQLLK